MPCLHKQAFIEGVRRVSYNALVSTVALFSVDFAMESSDGIFEHARVLADDVPYIAIAVVEDILEKVREIQGSASAAAQAFARVVATSATSPTVASDLNEAARVASMIASASREIERALPMIVAQARRVGQISQEALSVNQDANGVARNN